MLISGKDFIVQFGCCVQIGRRHPSDNAVREMAGIAVQYDAEVSQSGSIVCKFHLNKLHAKKSTNSGKGKDFWDQLMDLREKLD